MNARDRDIAAIRVCPCRNNLAGVKRSIYHPGLPTLRHMERDDLMCKLPDEHSRTSTLCTARDFEAAECRPFKQAPMALPCLPVTQLGHDQKRDFKTLGDLQRMHEIWVDYMKDGKSQMEKKLFCDVNNKDDWHFDGVALKIIKPEVKDERLTLRCEPGLDRSGYRQRLTPSDTAYRHRASNSVLPCHLFNNRKCA